MITPWKTLTAHTVCSNDHLLKEEIKYLEHSFAVTNGCPKCFLEHTLESFESPRVISQVTDNSRQNRVYILKLPFKREQGNKIKLISNTANRMLSSNHEPRFILTATRLGFKFNINGKTEHNHDFFYSAKCPHSNCTDKYIEETLNLF